MTIKQAGRKPGLLWAEVYDRELTAPNIFEIQTEMATAIADALHASLTSNEQQKTAALFPRLCEERSDEAIH